MSNQRSLSVIYYDPEAEPVPEPDPEPASEPTPAPKKGRPAGSKNKPKTKPKRNIPWFTIWRVGFWGAAVAWSIIAAFVGVRGWLGDSAAYIVVAVSVPIAAFLLDRDWKKMRR